MTLEEAIEHCKQKADELSICNKDCSLEHKQLFIWLSELKAIKEMIDDKKIEDAKDDIFEEKFLNNGTDVIFNDEDEYKEEMYDSGQIKEAIELGAHWAINGFLNDLWHDIYKEHIPPHKRVLVEYTFEGGFHYKSLRLPDDNHWLKSFVKEKRIRRWLYVDDLL